MENHRLLTTSRADDDTPPCAVCGQHADFDLHSDGFRRPACRGHYSDMVDAALVDRPPMWANDLIALGTKTDRDPRAIVSELLTRVHPGDRYTLLGLLANAVLGPLTGVKTEEDSVFPRVSSVVKSEAVSTDRPLVLAAFDKAVDRMAGLWFGYEEPRTLVDGLRSLAHNAEIAQLLIRDLTGPPAP